MQCSVGREAWIIEKNPVGRLRGRNDWIGKNLRFPAQAETESQVWPDLPLVLRKQREVFILDLEAPAASVAGPVGPRALKVKQQVSGVVIGSEARARKPRRGITEKAADAVEDITALEEPAEDLRIDAVHPLATQLNCVSAGYD